MKTPKDKLKEIGGNAREFLRWILLAMITGLIVGPIGAAFVKALSLANVLRGNQPQIILGLPLSGLVIVFLYKICKYDNKRVIISIK